MSHFVIDFQAFKTLDNKFVLKEVAIINIFSGITHLINVRPYCSRKELSREMQWRVDYLTKNVHGLKWNSGYVYEHEAIDSIYSSLIDAKVVYIKGEEKAKYISSLLSHRVPVINLDNLGAVFNPKYKKILKCGIAGYKHEKLRCAYKQAIAYKNWLIEKGWLFKYP